MIKRCEKSIFSYLLPIQGSCNKEGFNVFCASRVRIGLWANNEGSCDTCDSKIGFGLASGYTCGNTCKFHCDAGDLNLKAFGYILVQ